MEMTRERLDAYRSNRLEIKELDYILNNRWKSETMISVDTILNYRKGYPVPEGIAGFDQDRYERLQDRDIRKKSKLIKECKEIEEYVNSIPDSITRRIFRLYFIEGDNRPTQERVADKLYLERSSISKKINGFLQDSHNSQKSQV